MLGLLTVGAKGELLLDSGNLRYLRTLADQVSLVVQGQQALQSAHRTVEQFQRIIAFSQAAEATFDRASIFDLMMTESAQMFPADFINIALYNVDQQQLLSIAQRMNNHNQVNLDSEWVISQTDTTSGRIWEQGELLYIPDLEKEADVYHPLRDDLRAMMGAPIHSRGEALGLVEIGSFAPHAYNDADVAMFQQMVRQLATTIENAEVYIQGQNLAKNKALAGEIAAELQQQVDLDSILNIAVHQLGQTLGARRGRIRLSTDFDMDN
jgi:GAF domain-containing protein